MNSFTFFCNSVTVGVILALGLYHLYLFIKRKDKSYFYFFFLMVSTSIFVVFGSGIGNYAFNITYGLNGPVQVFSGVLLIYFMKKYLSFSYGLRKKRVYNYIYIFQLIIFFMIIVVCILKGVQYYISKIAYFVAIIESMIILAVNIILVYQIISEKKISNYFYNKLSFFNYLAICAFFIVYEILVVVIAIQFPNYSPVIIFYLIFSYVISERFHEEYKLLIKRSKELIDEQNNYKELNDTLEEQVKERTAEVTEQNRQLEEQKTELRQQNEKLTEQEFKLRESYHQLALEKDRKANLLTNAAHEIKTPHTLIRSNIERLALKFPDLAEDRHFQGLKAEVNRVITDAHNILDEDRMNREVPLYFHDEIFCLSSLLEDKALLFESFAGVKEIRIEREIDDELYLMASSAAIDKIINNLLDNGIKYTQKGGYIRVSAKEKKGKIELVVKDNGMGIAESELPHIFERNYQISKKKEISQGVGVGLFLVKKIVVGLGGEINVTSLEGEGTAVQILFTPYKLQDGESISDYTLTTPVYNPDTSLDVKDSEMRKGLKTLLIVEDEPPLLKSIKEWLEKDYNILAATNGKSALKRLEKATPDLIISDIMMPCLNGIEFCKRVREQERFNEIPFIFLTAKTTEKQRVAGLKLGAVDYISKPFNFEELELRLQNNFLLHEKLRENSRLSKENEMLKNFQARIKNLTATQKKLAKIIIENPGSTNIQLGELMGISPDTINSHIRNMALTLRVATNKDAVEECLLRYMNPNEELY